MVEDRPHPKHYLRHAAEINRAAAYLLIKENGQLNTTSAMVSIGLSLQAMELCGKAMLRALDHYPSEIRQEHRRRQVLQLLQHVQNEIRASANPDIKAFKDFLLHTLTIDGVEFGNTIEAYLEKYFDRGKTAYPRNYFYPDYETFTAPHPISAIFSMSEYLIEIANQLSAATGYEPQ